MIDFKILTLDLYNQVVKVTFKEGTECNRIYGNSLTGKLTGRIWTSGSDAKNNMPAVIGITISTPEEDIDITCSEIEKIEIAR